MTTVTEQIAALTARLDKQAAAIKTLRARVAALEEAAAQPVVSEPSDTGSPDAGWAPPPTCPMCGTPRDPGRKTLTCPACSGVRNRIISEHLDRAPITRTSCCSCGAKFKAAARFLCADCSTAFRIWKAHQ